MAQVLPVLVSGPSGRRLYGGGFPPTAAASGAAALADLMAGGSIAPTPPAALSGGAALGEFSASGGLSAAAPPPGGTITAVALTPSSTAAHPFAFGQAFRQGDIPPGATLAGLQLTRISTWPDGSAKVGLVAGIMAMTSGQATSVSLAVGAPASGTAPTVADLQATGIVAAFGAGAFGSASFSGADWTSPHRVWASGPVMSSWLYRKPIGSDATLVAWLEVRLWQGGAVEVLPWIENGYVLVAGHVNKSETFTFSLGGTQRFSAAIDLPARCRTPLLSGAALSYWLGTDPGITVSHDRAYLMATKVVPNYPRSIANTATLIAGMPNNLTPLSQGMYRPVMSAAGGHGSIGLLPEWDVAYLACPTSAKPWIELQHQAYRWGRYGVHYRDENTQKPARLTDHPTRVIGSGNVSASGVSSTNSYATAQSGTVPPSYAVSHHPSAGFLAAMLTGRCYHVETCQFAASIVTLFQSDALRGQGVGAMRLRSYMQPRGYGWALRTLGQAVAITPDSDPLQAEYKGHISATVDYAHARYIAQPSNPLGFMDMENPDYPEGRNPSYVTNNNPPLWYSGERDPYLSAPWMHDFIVQSIGYMRHLVPDIGDSQAKLVAWFDWLGKSVVGRFGGVGPTEYLYRDAACYVLPFAPKDNSNWANGSGPWYPNWGVLWNHTWLDNGQGSSVPAAPDVLFPTYLWDSPPAVRVKEIGDGSLRGGGILNPRNYWHNMLPALSYCVDHGVAGAVPAFERLTSAPNFESGVAAYFNNANPTPEGGVFPRNVFSWAASLALDTWQSLPNTGFRAWAIGGGVPSGAYQGTNPIDGMLTAYCDPATDKAAAVQYVYGGGHGDGTCNAVSKFDWRTLAWTLVGQPTPPSKYPPIYSNGGSSMPGPMTYPSGLSSVDYVFLPAPPLTEAVDLPYATTRARASTHMYGAAVLRGSIIHYMYLRYGEFDTSTGTWRDTSGFNFLAQLVALGYGVFNQPVFSTALDIKATALYDEVTDRIYATFGPGDSSGGRNGILEFNGGARQITAIYSLPGGSFGPMLSGESLTQVGRKLYCFTQQQGAYYLPSKMTRGFIFDMDSKTFQWFVLAAGPTVDADSTFTPGANTQETIPCVWDGQRFWRWNFGSTTTRNQLLLVDLNPTSGAGTIADPFVLTQTRRAIGGTLPGTPMHLWTRFFALAPGLLVCHHDARQDAFALKLS